MRPSIALLCSHACCDPKRRRRLPCCVLHCAAMLLAHVPHCAAVQLTPACVYQPKKAEEQILRIASGPLRAWLRLRGAAAWRATLQRLPRGMPAGLARPSWPQRVAVCTRMAAAKVVMRILHPWCLPPLQAPTTRRA